MLKKLGCLLSPKCTVRQSLFVWKFRNVYKFSSVSDSERYAVPLELWWFQYRNKIAGVKRQHYVAFVEKAGLAGFSCTLCDIQIFP